MTGTGKSKGGVATGVFWSALRSWGSRVATLVVFLVLSRILSPVEIGLASFAIGLVALLAVFCDFGLAEYAVYNKTNPEIETSIWWFQLAVSLLLTVGVCTALYQNWWIVSTESADANEVMMAMCITLPFLSVIRIPEAIIRRRMDFRSLAIRSFISVFVGAAVAISMAWRGYGVWSLVAKQVIEAVVDSFLLFKFSGWRPQGAFAKKSFFLSVSGGWGMIGSRILDVVGQRADAVIIGSMMGMAELGFYSLALRVYQVLNEGIVQPVTGVIATAFGHVKTQPGRLREFFIDASQYAAFLTVPIFVLAICLGDDWLPIVFGEKWTSSGTILQVLCISGLLIGYSGLNGFALLANNRNGPFLLLMTYATTLSVGLMAFLSQYGVVFAALALPLKALLTFPVSFYLAQRLVGFSIREYFFSLLPIFGMCAVIGAVYGVVDFIALEAGDNFLGQVNMLNVLVKTAIVVAVGGILFKIFFWKRVLTLRGRLHV